MATDFFARQDTARRNTIWLVVLFSVAMVAIVGCAFLGVYFAAEYLSGTTNSLEGSSSSGSPQSLEPEVLGLGGALVALALIVFGSLYKVVQLRHGGGQLVAESIGGQRLYPNADDPSERRLLNVVEEMAIAAGVPVPPVFLIEEDAINAFAAGYSSSDAVLGVTRGTCEQLSRQELQGVIAHEFSHVLHGDMRMNIRLIGILHGILLFGLLGHLLLRSASFGGRGRGRDRSGGKEVLVLLALGLLFYLLGSLGTLIGSLIKAGVSRQREYLADASAVQYTRNPEGISGALKQIGAGSHTSRITHPNAPAASHMYFAQGVFEGFTGLMATHPPLAKRIVALDPDWDGTYPERRVRRRRPPAQPGTDENQASRFAGAVDYGQASQLAGQSNTASHETPPAAIRDALDSVGHPAMVHHHYATALLQRLPQQIIAAAREPASARAVVMAMLLDQDDAIRTQQLNTIDQKLEPKLAEITARYWELLSGCGAETRLPLVDLALPALRSMSAAQYAAFDDAIKSLIKADQKLSVFEWTLARVMMRHLEPQFRPVRSPLTVYYGLQRLGQPISVLLSILARVGHRDDEVDAAFHAGASSLQRVAVHLLAPDQCSLHALNDALARLAKASAPERGKLIDACANTICSDAHVTVAEGELLRGIADLLDCPVPPIVAATGLAEGRRDVGLAGSTST